MEKAASTFCGCLTGMITLVLITVAATGISDYLYNAPFHYKKIKCVASNDGEKFAHLFTNTSKKNGLAPYIGVSLSRNKHVNRDYEAEVFTISPPDALDSMDLIWLNNDKLELKFRIDSNPKVRIHYGRPPSIVRRVIFTELSETSESSVTNVTMEPNP